MRKRSRIRFSSLILCLLAACGGEERVTTSLAYYSFAGESTSVFGRGWGDNTGVHWFASGFTGRENTGVWTLGREATLHLHVLGRGAVFELDVGTEPGLSARGQELTVLWNGAELATRKVDGGFETRTLLATVPDDLLRQGMNEVVLRPRLLASEVVAKGDAPRRPRGVYVKALRLAADLDADERERWRELIEQPPLPELDVVSAPPALVGPAPDPARLPDVLVVLLDAARADHFGSYGYPRDTSPVFDRLAGESVVCRDVTSVSPFTLIAVASLLTARSWRDHGVVLKDQALGDGMPTLAELMRDAGYLTLGWSDNPYVGRGSGLDRGFDEFVEVWKHPRHAELKHLLRSDEDWYVPHRLPEMVDILFRERLAAGFGDGPVFGYVHIMPPHGPYVPTPEHDHFTDPDYAGAIDGSTAQYGDLVNHRLPLDAEDLRHLIGLYDGNLRRADAILGRVVAAWRALERERELLLVVLSDHGEAFGEHGAFGHLSTLHDEMLRVPLILWPADRWRDVAPAARGHLSLLDLPPLILRQVGAKLPEGSRWHRRFVELMTDPSAGAREFVVARTFVDANRFGVRSQRWLAFTDGFRVQELYDLAADPAAERNLRRERPATYTRLIQRLRATLEASRRGEVEDSGLTDADREALEAVGYL